MILNSTYVNSGGAGALKNVSVVLNKYQQVFYFANVQDFNTWIETTGKDIEIDRLPPPSFPPSSIT